jgi:hypothetical protein
MQFTHATNAIDTIKDAKATVLKTLVTDETFRKPLQAMVDAEAQLAKATVKSIEEMVAKFKVA